MNIDVKKFLPGMEVEEDIVKGNTCMVRKGTILTEDRIEKLKKLGISSLKINRIKYEKLLDNEQEKEKTISSKLMSDTGNSLSEFMKEPNASNMDKVQDNAKAMVKAIEESDKFIYSIDKIEEEVEAHSTRVTCFSILLAKIYDKSIKSSYPNVNEENLINLEDIACAALFHDIGTTCIKDERLNQIKEILKKSDLEKKYPRIKNVPLDHYDNDWSSVYSFLLVQGNNRVSDTAKGMIIASKDLVPEGQKDLLQGTTESIGVQIIRVCDLYDKSMKRTLESGTSLENVAMALGQWAANGIINRELVHLFLNNIPLYPVGTKVILSTGELASVVQSGFGQYGSFKPTVLTRPLPGREINLDNQKNTNITIDTVINGEHFQNLMQSQINMIKHHIKTDKYR